MVEVSGSVDRGRALAGDAWTGSVPKQQPTARGEKTFATGPETGRDCEVPIRQMRQIISVSSEYTSGRRFLRTKLIERRALTAVTGSNSATII